MKMGFISDELRNKIINNNDLSFSDALKDVGFNNENRNLTKFINGTGEPLSTLRSWWVTGKRPLCLAIIEGYICALAMARNVRIKETNLVSPIEIEMSGECAIEQQAIDKIAAYILTYHIK